MSKLAEVLEIHNLIIDTQKYSVDGMDNRMDFCDRKFIN